MSINLVLVWKISISKGILFLQESVKIDNGSYNPLFKKKSVRLLIMSLNKQGWANKSVSEWFLDFSNTVFVRKYCLKLF